MRLWKSSTAPPPVVEDEAEDVPVPTATSARPVMTEPERSEYEKVAASIGLADSPALLADQIKAFFAEENIHIFDNDAVGRYLNGQFPDGWEWRGVRDKDVERLSGWSNTLDGKRISFSHRRYTRAIPLPVLVTMQKVLGSFPNVYFYVSEPKDNDGDPFLMVTDRDIKCFIVERWDEPSFRDK